MRFTFDLRGRRALGTINTPDTAERSSRTDDPQVTAQPATEVARRPGEPDQR